MRLLVASLLACSCKPDAPDAPVEDIPVSGMAPSEDEDAVPGGPVDLSDFDFDVDAPDEKGPPPTLMGIDAVRPETAAALAPDLQRKVQYAYGHDQNGGIWRRFRALDRRIDPCSER